MLKKYKEAKRRRRRARQWGYCSGYGTEGSSGSYWTPQWKNLPLGFWNFNGNALDASGAGNDFTVSGAQLTTDKNGGADRAYLLDGTNDYLSRTRIVIPDNVFTLVLRFKANSWTDYASLLVGAAPSNYSAGWGVAYQGGYLCFWMGHYSTVSASKNHIYIPIADTTLWHYLYIKYSKALGKMFFCIDMGFEYQASVDYDIEADVNKPATIFIGQGLGGYFAGKIDEVYFCNEILSRSVLKQSGFMNTPVKFGYWKAKALSNQSLTVNKYLLDFQGEKLITFDGGTNYLQYSGDKGLTYNTGIDVTTMQPNVQGRILANGNIVISDMKKGLYYSDDNLTTLQACTILDAAGDPYVFHTPANSSYPGAYFQWMGGFEENNGVAVLGNYTNANFGASPINLYYTLDGITWKVFYTFGQNIYFTDNGTATGGLSGTLLGDAGNGLKARHFHAVNIGDDGNFYACTGEAYDGSATGEAHFLKCVYNSIADIWTVTDLLIPASSLLERYRALGVYLHNGFLYWGGDGTGTQTVNGTVYKSQGIFKCAVSDINDISKHVTLKDLDDSCYSFVNKGKNVIAGMMIEANVYVSLDYGETWTAYAKPSWMAQYMQDVSYNETYKCFRFRGGWLVGHESF